MGERERLAEGPTVQPPTPAPRAQRDRISEAPRKRQAPPLLSVQIHILIE